MLALGPEPPHALLLVGPVHTGRSVLAREYALLLNCERLGPPPAGAPLFDLPGPAGPADEPCGTCRPCRLILEGTHPDVLLMAPGDSLCRPQSEGGHDRHPDSRDVRLCQVRGAIELVSRFPYEARHRVIVIDPAERITLDAANGLLQTLEEPPPHTAFILVSAAPEELLETIISRCRRIDVGHVPRNTIESALLERGVDPALAATAAEAARGKPGRALAFVAQPDLIGDRDRLLKRCERLAAAPMAERIKYSEELRERWMRDRNSVLNELDLWQDFWEARLHTAAAASDRASALADVEALQAITKARDQLMANVQFRPAALLMLLSFPRTTLPLTPEEEVVAANG